MTIGMTWWNDGSLVRRTALHVLVFVLGSLAVIVVASFVSIRVADGLFAPNHGRAPQAEASPASAVISAPRALALPPARAQGKDG